MIIPSVNVVLEPEAHAILPRGYAAHFTRVPYDETPKGFAKMIEEVPRAAMTLRDARVDAICYACTTGGLYRGKEFDEELGRRVQLATGVASTTTSAAVVEALEALDAKRVSLVTPYQDWLNRKVVRFLEESGFETRRVTKVISRSGRAVDIEPRFLLRRTLDGFDEDSDAIFLSCTGLRTFEILQELERRTKKRVVSSNQATIWRLLKMTGRREGISGYGALMSRHL